MLFKSAILAVVVAVAFANTCTEGYKSVAQSDGSFACGKVVGRRNAVPVPVVEADKTVKSPVNRRSAATVAAADFAIEDAEAEKPKRNTVEPAVAPIEEEVKAIVARSTEEMLEVVEKIVAERSATETPEETLEEIVKVVAERAAEAVVEAETAEKVIEARSADEMLALVETIIVERSTTDDSEATIVEIMKEVTRRSAEAAVEAAEAVKVVEARSTDEMVDVIAKVIAERSATETPETTLVEVMKAVTRRSTEAIAEAATDVKVVEARSAVETLAEVEKIVEARSATEETVAEVVKMIEARAAEATEAAEETAAPTTLKTVVKRSAVVADTTEEETKIVETRSADEQLEVLEKMIATRSTEEAEEALDATIKEIVRRATVADTTEEELLKENKPKRSAAKVPTAVVIETEETAEL